MIIIVFKLFSTYRTYYMVCTGLWFFDFTIHVFFLLSQLPSLANNIFIILLIQKLCVCNCEFAFPQKLKYTSSEWCIQIEIRNIVLSYCNTKYFFKLLLICWSIILEKMKLLSISIQARCSAIWDLMCGKSSLFKCTNYKMTFFCGFLPRLYLCTV